MKSRVHGPFPALSDFEIEAFLCGELQGSAQERAERLLASDEAFRAYVQSRREARESFATRHPLSPRVREAVAKASGERRSGMRRYGLASFGLAASLALATLLWVRSEPARTPESLALSTEAPEADRVRIKGQALAVTLFVLRGEEVFQHEPSLPLAPGDRVRLRVDDARGGYVTVLARDASGAISVYYEGLRVTPGHYLFPDSLALDASFADEHWLVIVDDRRRPAASYVESWRNGKLPTARHRILHLTREQP